jgi:hypothetical protein
VPGAAAARCLSGPLPGVSRCPLCAAVHRQPSFDQRLLGFCCSPPHPDSSVGVVPSLEGGGVVTHHQVFVTGFVTGYPGLEYVLGGCFQGFHAGVVGFRGAGFGDSLEVGRAGSLSLEGDGDVHHQSIITRAVVSCPGLFSCRLEAVFHADKVFFRRAGFGDFGRGGWEGPLALEGDEGCCPPLKFVASAVVSSPWFVPGSGWSGCLTRSMRSQVP